MSIIENLLDDADVDSEDVVEDEDVRQSANETVSRGHKIGIKCKFQL